MSAAAQPTVVSARRVAVLLGVLIALTVIGSSAVAVALPVLSADLELTTGGAAWVLAAFSLTFSISTAVFGRVADLAGLRTPLRIGAVMFALGSLLAALSGSFTQIIGSRLLQGAGAGAVPVLAVGIVNARFDGPARARALGGLTAVVTIVSGSGPLIGGALTQWLGWRSVLAVPVTALVLSEPVARLAPTTARGRGRLDVSGALLVAAAVTGIALLLQAPATGVGSAGMVALVLMVLVAGAGLVLHIRRRPHGFLPVEVVTNRVLMASAFVAMATLGAYIAMLFAVPKILTAALGWSPLQIGLAMLPGAALAAAMATVAGSLASRADRHRVVLVFTVASTSGLVLAAVAGGTSPVLLLVGFGLVAGAFGGAQVVLIDGIPRVVRPAVHGVALGVFNVVFFTGGAIGASAAGGLAERLGLAGALGAVAVLPLVATALVRRTRS